MSVCLFVPPELEEADLPEPHVLEGRVRVLPALQPVRGTEGDQEQYTAYTDDVTIRTDLLIIIGAKEHIDTREKYTLTQTQNLHNSFGKG